MTSPVSNGPLGLLRLRAEARLEEFAESCNMPAEDLWEVAMTAQTFPEDWEGIPGAWEFWAAFTQLKSKEIEEFASAG